MISSPRRDPFRNDPTGRPSSVPGAWARVNHWVLSDWRSATILRHRRPPDRMGQEPTTRIAPLVAAPGLGGPETRWGRPPSNRHPWSLSIHQPRMHGCETPPLGRDYSSICNPRRSVEDGQFCQPQHPRTRLRQSSRQQHRFSTAKPGLTATR
jgi:hypothetical protein